MVRKYGIEPYRIAVIHGGPGGMGSVAGLARELSKAYGVIEPLQSKYSIGELIEELKEQLLQDCNSPALLIGHSWGAWLAGLFAARYPELVCKVLLIGCGPLTLDYVERIGERRKANLTREEAEELEELIGLLNQPKSKDMDRRLKRLGQLAETADYYCKMELPIEPLEVLPANGEMYANLWPEAAQLRKSGELLHEFLQIKCALTIIQGDSDPHPYEGVIEPLTEGGRKHRFYLLEKCGHTPWKEQYAASDFYRILNSEIMEQTLN